MLMNRLNSIATKYARGVRTPFYSYLSTSLWTASADLRYVARDLIGGCRAAFSSRYQREAKSTDGDREYANKASGERPTEHVCRHLEHRGTIVAGW